jgi:hypothetical protein
MKVIANTTKKMPAKQKNDLYKDIPNVMIPIQKKTTLKNARTPKKIPRISIIIPNTFFPVDSLDESNVTNPIAMQAKDTNNKMSNTRK